MIEATAISRDEARSEKFAVTKARLGFLGSGWIGRNRLEAVAKSGLAEVAVIAEPDRALAEMARKSARDAELVGSLDDLLDFDLDGVVIATPSAMHAEQATRALRAGIAVFCQKPLGRTGQETSEVIETARSMDRLLGVDLSYRHLTEVLQARELVQSGELGGIFAVDLVFHNAYGPDKEWFYNRKLSGGGCVIDLGIHLVDLALWTLDFPNVTRVSSQLFHQGRRLGARPVEVEDYAIAQIDLSSGASAQLACSWRLSAGQHAVISASFYGTKGAARVSNIDGSFYRFRAEHFSGTARELLSEDPEPWGGRGIIDWVQRLNRSNRFDPEVESLSAVANTLDRIYEGGGAYV
jgi:predicted dehydrogenase